MRILYIDQHAAGPGGGDCRAMQLVRGWQEAGEEAAVLTAGRSRRRCIHVREYCFAKAPMPPLLRLWR